MQFIDYLSKTSKKVKKNFHGPAEWGPPTQGIRGRGHLHVLAILWLRQCLSNMQADTISPFQ